MCTRFFVFSKLRGILLGSSVEQNRLPWNQLWSRRRQFRWILIPGHEFTLQPPDRYLPSSDHLVVSLPFSAPSPNIRQRCLPTHTNIAAGKPNKWIPVDFSSYAKTFKPLASATEFFRGIALTESM